MRYEHYSADIGVGKKIRAIGWSDDPGITRHTGRREDLILHYCLRGSGTYNDTPVHAGEGFVILPGQDARYAPSDENPWSFVWVIFAEDGFSEYLPLIPAGRNGVFSYPFVSEVQALADRIRKRYAEQRNVPSLFPATAAMELFSLHEEYGRKERRSAGEEYAVFARTYIDANHFRSELSVRALCEKIGISQPYLYLLFRELFGTSPKEYIDTARENHARRLLLCSSLSVAEVAAACGFSDPFAFSVFFKRRTGLSPRHFRTGDKGAPQTP